MRLDHLSYAVSHEQISDVANRIGSQIGTAFVDGGIHPRFGTRHFTAPLLNGHYIEIVCPIDHPSTENSPFGKIVSKKVESGGGWLAWVISTPSINPLEEYFSRKSIIGIRKKPNGTELAWKQIGVLDTLERLDSPFYIEWLEGTHPSQDGVAQAKILEINILGNNSVLNPTILKNLSEQNIRMIWNKEQNDKELFGIQNVVFEYNTNKIVVV
jgi:hypothetical protein